MGEGESMRREFKQKSKVLLIDDNYEHLVGIRELLNLEGTFDVVGIATNVTVGLNLIKKYQPNIVLLDMNMPDKDGLQGIMEIEKLDIDTKILALSGYDDADLIFRAMKIGAKGYVLKTMASAQLIYAIEEVLNGKIYLPLALSSRFFEYFQQSFRDENAKQQSGEENLLSYLTQREEEVLELLTQGVTYKGVAGKLFISETTVKTHVNNIFQKLQVNDRTQAVLYAIEEVLNGKIYLPLALSSRFFEYFQQSFKEETAKQQSGEENLLSYLTQREEEVLELLTQGVTYKGVAGKLFISETTVKTHVNNIFQKLQVNDRTQAVLYAINNGFLTKKGVNVLAGR